MKIQEGREGDDRERKTYKNAMEPVVRYLLSLLLVSQALALVLLVDSYGDSHIGSNNHRESSSIDDFVSRCALCMRRKEGRSGVN